jgi:imidazolonepropionase-like amidohydrolase
VIPTLTLFDFEARKMNLPDREREDWIANAVGQLRSFSQAGGEVIFGTDIGYTDHFDTEMEFQLMSRAGMDYRAILASLTTTPARRFGFADRSGRLQAGLDADFVVLDGDPAKDVSALAKVKATIKSGKVIFRRQ